MLGHGPRKHNLLQVLALQHQAVGRVLVGDAGHVLLNDGAGIQLGCHVMAGGTDDFHAALPGLVVGLGSHEGGQERVVNVDDVVRVFGNHLVRDNLHVAGQHDERDVLLPEQLHFGLFHLSLVRVVFLDAPHVVGNLELFGHVAQVLVVRHDAGYLTLIFTGLPACQQVVQAVAHLRHEDGHARTLVAVVERELHLVALGIQRADVFVYLVARYQETVQFPLYAHEENAVLAVNVLVEIDNISLIVGNKLGYFRYNALLVGAV